MREPATKSDTARLERLIERRTLHLTVNLGVLLLVAFWVLAAFISTAP